MVNRPYKTKTDVVEETETIITSESEEVKESNEQTKKTP